MSVATTRVPKGLGPQMPNKMLVHWTSYVNGYIEIMYSNLSGPESRTPLPLNGSYNM